MNEVLQIILITFLPFLELRASIPWGILRGMHWLPVFLIAVITNFLLAYILYLLIDEIIRIATQFRFVKRIWDSYVMKAQRKVHPYIEKYGEIGLAIFIGIPLPGSGVYTGAIAAYFLGLDRKKYLIASLIGVIIAGLIVTLAVTLGNGAFHLLFKQV